MPVFSRSQAAAWGVSVDMDPSAVILASEFATAGSLLSDFTEPLRESVRYVMAPSLRQNIDEGGRPRQWPPLSEYTILSKAKEGAQRPSDPLIRTGALMDVVGSADLWTIQPNYAALETLAEADYGIYHQYGTDTIPARPFLVFQTEDEERIESIFIRWTQRQFEYSGFRSSASSFVEEVTTIASETTSSITAPTGGFFGKVASKIRSIFRRR